MAHDGIEVEVKIPLSAKEFSQLKQALEARAKFEKKTLQVDEYYTPAHKNFLNFEFPFEWLSIRKRGDKAILNYKHFHPENVEITTHCDEFETEVKNIESLEKLLKALDFKQLVVVEKERELFNAGDFEISLDSVRNLGYFVEIEALKSFGSVEDTRKKIFSFAQSFGLDVFSSDKRGYPFMLLKKKGLIDEKRFLKK